MLCYPRPVLMLPVCGHRVLFLSLFRLAGQERGGGVAYWFPGRGLLLHSCWLRYSFGRWWSSNWCTMVHWAKCPFACKWLGVETSIPDRDPIGNLEGAMISIMLGLISVIFIFSSWVVETKFKFHGFIFKVGRAVGRSVGLHVGFMLFHCQILWGNVGVTGWNLPFWIRIWWMRQPSRKP